MVFESVFYKGTSRITFLFELFIRLHMVHMRGYLIHRVVNTVVTIMIESGFDGISGGGNMGGNMRVLYPLQFDQLCQV